MINKLLELTTVATSSIANSKSIQELNEIKALYLGKKSPLSEIMGKMRELSVEEKKELGQKANEFKRLVEEKVSEKRVELEEQEVLKKLNSEEIDVTLPGKSVSVGSLHPLTRVIEEIEDTFIGMGYEIAEGPEVELDLYNFELLNLPVGHPAREMQDTFYINPTTLLRTHTSPVQARTMLAKNGEPIKVICPGKVYRRDADDATHSHQFMQTEGLVLGKNVSMADLKGTLTTICSKIFGGDLEVRFRPSFFPFTEPSVEVDVTCFKCKGKGCSLCKGSGWIEVLGAGMVNPHVLEMNGYDPNEIQGFAFGIGVERFTMLRHGIDDIRNFYINDYKFLKQF